MTARNSNNLDRVESSLPGHWYYDPGQYERELDAVWYRQWVFLCRDDAVPAPTGFRTFTVGSQRILVVRDTDGTLRAFHNTCRHRGSVLCDRESGTPGRLITCPYHAWSYALDGRLAATPNWSPGADFDRTAHGLFPVTLRNWRGFLFVNLDPAPGAALEQCLDPGAGTLANWPLEELVPVHTRVRALHCNWKVFWENFLECYHCPGIHGELCSLVPIYSRSFMDPADQAGWEAHVEDPSPEYRGGLRAGAETWSTDGLAHGPRFPGLTAEEARRGHTFLTVYPAMFLVAHVDYLRFVSILPVSPEQTTVTVQVLMTPEGRDDPGQDLDNIAGFVTRLVDEDAGVCELNQKGLRALPFEHGLLVPQEYEVHAFHQWLHACLDRADDPE